MIYDGDEFRRCDQCELNYEASSLDEYGFCKECAESYKETEAKIEELKRSIGALILEASTGPVRHLGVVESFNDSKGYGFISKGETTAVFVHYTSIQGDGFKTLTPGQLVSFESESYIDSRGIKGLRATIVKKES